MTRPFSATLIAWSVAALILSFHAGAATGGSLAERLATQKTLRSAVESREGKFARLTSSDKTRLVSAQDRIFELLGDGSSSAELDSRDMSMLQAAETEVANIVASLDPTAKPKVVCSYKAPIGSNRKEKVCKQVSADNTEARETLRKMQPR